MALEIAKKSKGTITVLHILDVPIVYDPDFTGNPIVQHNSFLAAMQNNAKKEFEEMSGQNKHSVAIDFEMQIGGITESIQHVTTEKKIDLVLMGASSASAWMDVFIGSNTEKVVRFSKVPVLVVRQASAISGLKSILVPTTAKLDQTEFIEHLKSLQAFLGGILHILLVNTPSSFKRDSEGKEALEEFAKHYHLSSYHLHFKSYRSEEEGIIDFAYTNKMDLIAMATHSRKSLAHLFSGSIAEDVLNHTQIPVWTFSIHK